MNIDSIKSGFGQLEYVNNAFHAFASGTINYKNYRRYDRMYYEESQSRSEMIGFLEGSAKIGAVYELGEFGNFYANAGYLTRAPQFKNGVFMSVNNSNIINLNAKNEKSGTAEVVIYSIVNSLAELSDVNKVQISVDGKTNLAYKEVMPLSQIYERNLELVAE